jgi:hypothetical protein
VGANVSERRFALVFVKVERVFRPVCYHEPNQRRRVDKRETPRPSELGGGEKSLDLSWREDGIENGVESDSQQPHTRLGFEHKLSRLVSGARYRSDSGWISREESSHVI